MKGKSEEAGKAERLKGGHTRHGGVQDGVQSDGSVEEGGE